MNGPLEAPPPARAINEVEESPFGVLLRGFVTSRSGMLIFEVSFPPVVTRTIMFFIDCGVRCRACDACI